MARVRETLRPWTRQPQQSQGNVGFNRDFAEGLVWLSTPSIGNSGDESVVVTDLVNGGTTTQRYTAAEYRLERKVVTPFGVGIRAGDSAGGNPSGASYIGGCLNGKTELTLCVAFIKSESDANEQWVNFRSDYQHTLDVFGSTPTTLTFGADWGGAWNGADQQTVNAGDGLVVLLASINQSGARLFFNGVLTGTKSGGAFTTSSSSVDIYRRGLMAGLWISPILLHAAWGRALTDEQAIQITRNPWQLFEPRRILVPVSTRPAPAPSLNPRMRAVSRPWTQQPQYKQPIDTKVWPGRSTVVLPSLGESCVYGEVSSFTATDRNDPFGLVSTQGRLLGWRPNSSTIAGEVSSFTTDPFDIGADGSMIAILTSPDWAQSYSPSIVYGGGSWGLYVRLTSASSAMAAYVDDPLTSGYSAEITGLPTLANNEFRAVGLTKVGATVKVFSCGQMVSTTGGNGGMRKDSGGGGLGAYLTDNYGRSPLFAVTGAVVSDEVMLALTRHPGAPFGIFQQSLRVPATAATFNYQPARSYHQFRLRRN